MTLSEKNTSSTAPVSEGPWVGTALIMLSAAGFASLTLLGKIAIDLKLSLPTVLGLRFLGAALILGVGLGIARHQRLLPGRKLTLTLFLLGALGYAGQSALFFAGLSRNPASITSLLLYAYPVFVAILERIFHNRRLSSPQLWAMSLSLFGIFFIFGNIPFGMMASSTGVDIVGAFLILGSAFWYAGYIVTSNRYIHHAGPWVSTMWISLGAGFSFTLVGIVTGTWELPIEGKSYLIILAMILLSTIMALGAFLAGLQRVGPTTASLLSTLEPVITVFLAVILLNEHLSLNQLAGGGLILAAVILLTLAGSQSENSRD